MTKQTLSCLVLLFQSPDLKLSESGSSWCVTTNLFCASTGPAFTSCMSFCFKSLAFLSKRVCVFGVAICPVAVAPAELAALVHHGIILDRCCYLCSVSKPIILTVLCIHSSFLAQVWAHKCTRRKPEVLFS